jgi:N-acetyl-beta-hexosaminidase
MRNVSDKSWTENQNTHFMFNNEVFPENRAVYEIMWKNMVERDRPQMAIWRMRIA